jgi:hypothetical protein
VLHHCLVVHQAHLAHQRRPDHLGVPHAADSRYARAGSSRYALRQQLPLSSLGPLPRQLLHLPVSHPFACPPVVQANYGAPLLGATRLPHREATMLVH